MFSAGVLSIEVVGLSTTFNGEADRVAMPAVWRELVERLTAAAGLPLMPGRCSRPSCRFPCGRDCGPRLIRLCGFDCKLTFSLLGLVLFEKSVKFAPDFFLSGRLDCVILKGLW